nr:MAG TPA: hypothetical protein [Bacteriophage sp.]
MAFLLHKNSGRCSSDQRLHLPLSAWENYITPVISRQENCGGLRWTKEKI